MDYLHFKNAGLLGILSLTRAHKVFRNDLETQFELFEKKYKRPFTLDAEETLDEFAYTDQPGIFLVKDTGLYLMAAAKMDKLPDDMSHVCYAEGYSPDKPDWWEKCHAISGDDFGITFPFNQELQELVEQGCDIVVEVTEENFKLKTFKPR